MWKFIVKHGPAAGVGFAAGFAVGTFTTAGAHVKKFLFGAPKAGTPASNVVRPPVA